ncbi:RagB/SusD family nutrient uptake outer membrane protein [Chitinophaga sp. 22321]|uniref:RagB/SusD family nutrient uptake outer membrane protein n=1 Tax=Chitinophaga hostae TaxID=2831022 RepID=A0ABS5ISY1_9BACT|nr:RagB/SusD family nutrient uptake outer membrane protein [Chitinophaga hostae]MBS0026066.1 RagB/SusD family nutrient uptake outer membrane protein [Chitinophaga hostae]
MKKKKFIIFAFILAFAGCKDYLDIQPKDKLIPGGVEDFRLLLDDQWTMTLTPGIADIMADDLFLTEDQYGDVPQDYFQRSYTWSRDLFTADEDIRDWSAPYTIIFYANTILEGLAANPTGLQEARNQVQGEADFYRAYAYFNLLNTFAKQYNAATADKDLGVPLRLSSDVTAPVTRNSVKEVYTRILTDVNDAIKLLPVKAPFKTRPSRAAAHALAARIYLQMGDYDRAMEQATAGISLQNTLLDYRTVDPNNSPFDAVFPVTVVSNPEVIFISSTTGMYAKNYSISSDMHKLYNVHDLRASLFFREIPDQGNYQYIGSYNDGGSTNVPSPFSGFTVAELYLIRAECYARKNETGKAMDDLNALLVNRFEEGSFQPATAGSPKVALRIILQERRKELIFRNLRLMDLKRLNADPEYAITLTRTLNDETFTLPPGDNRYVFPIPAKEITATHLEQNPR